jgi:hypothetical protein
MHKFPLEADLEKFTIKDGYINTSIDGKSSISPYNGYVHGYTRYLNTVEISLKGFDTDTIIWQDGRIQGYYKSSKMQYAANPVEWINLLLKHEYLKMV